MLRGFFHSQFFAKLFLELLPATIASAVGAYLINSYFKPAPPPQAAANAELVQIMRDQQALLADYLKKSTEAHQRADQAVAQETDKLKTAERNAIQALREAKTAELRALATAVTRAGEASERKLAARAAAAPTPSAAPAAQSQPIDKAHSDRAQIERVQAEKGQADKAVAGEPLRLHQPTNSAPQPQIAAQAPEQAQVPPQNPPQAQGQPQPIAPQQAEAEGTEDNALGPLTSAVAKIGRLPSRVLDWFSEPPPPRPPGDLPRPLMKAAM